MTVLKQCPTMAARGSQSRMRGGSILGSDVPSMATQYANMNRAAFDTRRNSTPTPSGCTRSEPIDATSHTRLNRWDVSDRKDWRATLAEQAAAKAAKIAAIREAKAALTAKGISRLARVVR